MNSIILIWWAAVMLGTGVVGQLNENKSAVENVEIAEVKGGKNDG